MSEGAHGAIEVDPEELTTDYQEIGEHAKAKLWYDGDGWDRRLYLRFRDPDDGRRYIEYSVDLPPATPSVDAPAYEWERQMVGQNDTVEIPTSAIGVTTNKSGPKLQVDYLVPVGEGD